MTEARLPFARGCTPGRLAAFACAVLLSSTVQTIAAPMPAASCANIQILSDELTQREARSYCSYAAREREKVEAFWGATWKEPIRIHVDGAYRISRALVPAHQGNRGFMEMPLARVRSNTGALLREIVHICAPNDNRLLAEGLAVYAHQQLAGNPAFPNFGKPLEREARARLGEIASIESLEAVRTPRPLGEVLNEQSAYVLAGSFVAFLIDRYGLPQFRKLYETGAYDDVYRKPLAALEKEWRSALSGRHD